MKHSKPTRNTPHLRSQAAKAAKQAPAPKELGSKTPSGEKSKAQGLSNLERQDDSASPKTHAMSDDQVTSSRTPSVLQRCLKQIIDKAEKAESMSVNRATNGGKKQPGFDVSKGDVSNDYEPVAPKVPKPQVPLER